MDAHFIDSMGFGAPNYTTMNVLKWCADGAAPILYTRVLESKELRDKYVEYLLELSYTYFKIPGAFLDRMDTIKDTMRHLLRVVRGVAVRCSETTQCV